MIDLRCGDCLDLLPTLDAGSVDAVVTDPPAGISFMGKEWDHHKGGREQWVAWMTAVMAECLRVVKPGGHAFVWALPRTSHWTATAIENAGWDVRDIVTHHFGSGFPKSHNLGDGRGTALKPASEHWILARKPLAESTVAANVAAWRTGGLNIDASRVEGAYKWRASDSTEFNNSAFQSGSFGDGPNTLGRFPANLILSHSEACKSVGAKRVKGNNQQAGSPNAGRMRYVYGERDRTRGDGYADVDGMETVEAWECAPGCPVAELDAQSGMRPGGYRSNPSTPDASDAVTYGMSGIRGERGYDDGGSGASRFFYVAKASRRERNAGCEGLPEVDAHERHAYSGLPDLRMNHKQQLKGASNHHPTVKPIALMRYLIRLITPPGGIVLDPFAGSGSTGVAAIHEGYGFIGIEREPEYMAIAQARIEAAAATLRQMELAV